MQPLTRPCRYLKTISAYRRAVATTGSLLSPESLTSRETHDLRAQCHLCSVDLGRWDSPAGPICSHSTVYPGVLKTSSTGCSLPRADGTFLCSFNTYLLSILTQSEHTQTQIAYIPTRQKCVIVHGEKCSEGEEVEDTRISQAKRGERSWSYKTGNAKALRPCQVQIMERG